MACAWILSASEAIWGDNILVCGGGIVVL